MHYEEECDSSKISVTEHTIKIRGAGTGEPLALDELGDGDKQSDGNDVDI